MSKKKSGAKKAKNRPSQRPSAPPIDLAPTSVPPSSSADDDAPDSGIVASAASPSIDPPPPPPDTLAPTSTSEPVAGAVEPHGDAAAVAAVAHRASEPAKTEVSPPEATPAGISVDVIPERASARKLHLEDDDDHAFFAGAADAEAKLHAEVVKQIAHEESVIRAPVRRVTPEMVARRDKMKRIVTAVVAVAGVISIGVFAKIAMGPKPHTFDESAVKAYAAKRVDATPPAPVKHEPVPAPKVDVPPPPEEIAAPIEASSAPVAATSAPAPASAAPAASTEAPAASASAASTASAATEASGAAPDPEKAKPLTKKALQALESGKYAVAIEQAAASVDADPTDANAYLYWGTALMEQGKRADAKAVFSRCLANAKRGPKHECASFARLRPRDMVT